MNKHFVFILGCPRSGTSALVKVLNSGRAFIQSELFALNVRPGHKRLVPEMFEFDQLEAALDNGGRVINKERLREAVEKNFVLGDKVPLYFRHMELLNESFPAAHYLFIYRNFPDVEASYEKRFLDGTDKWKIPPETAIDHWNEAACEALRWKTFLGDRLTVVRYEELFSRRFEIFSGNAKQLLESLSILVNVDTDQLLEKIHTRMLSSPPNHVLDGWRQDSCSSRQTTYSELEAISLKFLTTKLSIVICTYNRSELLDGLLSELARQIQGDLVSCLEVIVVTNNCIDDTDEKLRTYSENHSWLVFENEPQQGLSFARNRGAIKAKGKYICYLDDDAIPCNGYLMAMVSVIDQMTPDFLGGPIFPFYRSAKPFWFQDALEVRKYADCSGFFSGSISGGNFIVRRELLLELGLFSTDLGMQGTKLRLGEERELLERYKNMIPLEQQRIYYSLECAVRHLVPSSKMTLRYLMRRSFESGKMRVMLRARDTLKLQEGNAAVSGNTVLVKLKRLLVGRSRVYLPIRIIHWASVIVGICYQKVVDAFSGRITSHET